MYPFHIIYITLLRLDEVDDELVSATMIAAASEAAESRMFSGPPSRSKRKQPMIRNTSCYTSVYPMMTGLL